jgi:hypothetical protein
MVVAAQPVMVVAAQPVMVVAGLREMPVRSRAAVTLAGGAEKWNRGAPPHVRA